MKKIFLGLSLAAMIVACSQPKDQNKAESSKPKRAQRDTMPADAFTLNGLNAKEANTMADGFTENGNASSTTLSYWLSEQWVDNAYAILFKENPEADGIRIYMGLQDGKSTIIITPTQEVGMSASATSGKDHKDFFIKDNAFIHTNAAHDSAEYKPSVGASLYNPKMKCTDDGCGIELTNHISCDSAQTFVQAFMKHAITINTFSEWYPKSLIENLYNELHAANAAKVNADGIRMYIGRNGAGRDTFIIVTTKTENGVHTDYYECYYKGKGHHGRGDDFDHGEECPTSCGFVTWPRDGDTPNP